MSEFATPNAGDRSFDLSLRLLTVLVLIALAGSVSFLAYRWFAPRFLHGDNERVTATTSRPPEAPPAAVAGPAKGDEILMDPRRYFRCEEQGRVSYSDQACPNGTPAGEATGQPRPPRGAH